MKFGNTKVIAATMLILSLATIVDAEEWVSGGAISQMNSYVKTARSIATNINDLGDPTVDNDGNRITTPYAKGFDDQLFLEYLRYRITERLQGRDDQRPKDEIFGPAWVKIPLLMRFPHEFEYMKVWNIWEKAGVLDQLLTRLRNAGK